LNINESVDALVSFKIKKPGSFTQRRQGAKKQTNFAPYNTLRLCVKKVAIEPTAQMCDATEVKLKKERWDQTSNSKFNIKNKINTI
jgi:hypothetical protein